MYGYIVPDKLNMYFKDHILFRAFYCGNCLLTGKRYGQCARLTTNYDIAFLEAFLHSYLGVQPEYVQKACVLNPIRKKPTVKTSPLMEQIVALNILMSYHNLNDDVVDGEGLKKLLPRSLLKKGYRRAVKVLPSCDGIIKKRYAELRAFEQSDVTSIDRACDPFGKMMQECVREIAGEKATALLDDFCYHLARYIYLTDALDDLTQDHKKKAYNPFLKRWNDFTDKQQFVQAHRVDIEFCLNISINRCIESYNLMELTEGRNLLDNVIYLGLRRKFHQILDSDKKSRPEKI